MVRTAYDESGRSLVEFDGQLVHVEAKLHGRAARDRLVETLERDMLADREAGKNTLTIYQIRELAYRRAIRLVADKSAEIERGT